MERRTIRMVWLAFFGLQVLSVVCDQSDSKSSNPGKMVKSNSLKSNDPPSHFMDECDLTQGNLTCYQVLRLDPTYLSTISSLIVNIDIIQGQFKTMDQSGLLQVTYPFLGKLSIRNSSLEKVDSLPDSLIQIDLINNVNLSSVRFNQSILRRLEMLNLSNNRLDSIQDLSSQHNLKSLDLSGNKWDCRSNFSWILKLNESGVLVNGDRLLCWDSGKTDSWFEWSYSLLGQEKIKRKVNADCQNRTAGCSCVFASRGKEGRDSYSVQVDCSDKQMTSLPHQLPDYTDELDVSGNYLTNLDQVKNYSNQALKTIIADSNRIESILSLANSKFMANFSIFSLKHNRISPSQIPLEELVNVPNNTFQAKYVYLNNNSWECDCKMATDVRTWLWKNHHIVNDSSLLLCSRDGRKIPVMYLFPDAVCPTKEGQQLDAADQEMKIYLLHIVIYIEVALIVILGLTFAYDSWHYFRHACSLNCQGTTFEPPSEPIFHGDDDHQFCY